MGQKSRFKRLRFAFLKCAFCAFCVSRFAFCAFCVLTAFCVLCVLRFKRFNTHVRFAFWLCFEHAMLRFVKLNVIVVQFVGFGWFVPCVLRFKAAFCVLRFVRFAFCAFCVLCVLRSSVLRFDCVLKCVLKTRVLSCVLRFAFIVQYAFCVLRFAF